jgi:hypothetical protein
MFITQTVTVTTTYTYHAEFDSAEAAIGSKVGSNFTITWVPC